MGTTGRRKPNATVKANDDSGGKSGAGKRRKDAVAVDAASAAASDARAEVEGLAAAAPTESSEEDEDEEDSDKEEERAAKGDKRGRRSNSGTPQGTPAKKKIHARTELHEDECARRSDRAEKLALQKEVRELRAQLAGKNTVNIGCIHIFHVTDFTTLSGEHSSCQSEEAQIHWHCDQV